jgi:hypothetical protein
MGSIRTFDLNEIKNKCNISTFIETGTLYGDGVDYALEYDFDRVYSIEINKELYSRASAKYANKDKVEIIEGSSSDVLPDIIKGIDGNILFFLDAHFPGADAHMMSYRECCEKLDYNINLPLQAELQAISERCNKYKDVIIIDDLWLWEEGQYGSGDCDTHCKNHGHDITRKFVVGDKLLEPMIAPFNKTHHQKRIYNHQGYLTLLPN